MSFLIYPTLDLFCFDLREGLGENSTTVANSIKKFQEKLHFNHIAFPKDKETEIEYLELLPNKRSEFSKNGQSPFKGYYYPVRINDTLGLLIDCSVESLSNPTSKIPHSVDCFANLRDYINEGRNQQSAELGETWMISGEIPNNCPETVEEIAKNCYKALFKLAEDKNQENIEKNQQLDKKLDKQWENNLQGQGRLLGGFIFELWGEPGNLLSYSPLNPLDRHHVIITLFPDENSAKKAAKTKIISNWMRLLCYRSKILWAYQQSRLLKTELKQDFYRIEQEIKDIQQESIKQEKLTKLIPILNNSQKTLSDFSLKLSYFEYQFRTLEINLHNYKLCRERLQKICEEYSEELRQEMGGYLLRSSDLSFLEKFSNLVNDKYQLQMKKDGESLSPGLKLLEGLMNSIASVRNIMEIKQASRDRIFQNNIAIVGIGAAAASVVASASASYIGAIEEIPLIKNYLKWCQINKDASHLVIAINFSIFVGVLIALLTAAVIKIGELMRMFDRDRP